MNAAYKKTINTLLLITVIALIAGPLIAADQPPAPRDRDAIEAVLEKAPATSADQKKMHVVLLAGKKDHGPEGNNLHDYPRWQKCWNVLMGGKNKKAWSHVNLYGKPVKPEGEKAGLPGLTVSTAWDWPSPEQLATADVIVMFCAPKWNKKTLADLKAFLARGGGFVVVHMAIWQDSPELAEILGLAKGRATKYRHGHAKIQLTAANHPICKGLPKTMEFDDETYYNFQGNPDKVTVLATCDETLPGQKKATAEPMYWLREVGKGRVFVCILGHFTWTFDDPYFRLLLLRGTAWAAGGSPYRLDKLVLRGARVKP